ncbi:glycosyltransferase family 2 protein [Acidiphilium acidophilum]|uniref:glycosyltransferase family 2 protein n=1 Tax=Acidiphilium acidophilum TaxID=76588 RepID=UPI002E8E70D7|nr:glycosyltransferase family 2 protein [Acidiphilium acidophilum]
MMDYKYKYSVVVCARWESNYIVEWLNYYRAIGFSHIFLYCNDDGPENLYEKVLPFVEGSDPFVTFRYYPYQGQQLRMYAHFLKHDRNLSEWISFFDVDEYLRLPENNTISHFMHRFDAGVDCVLFNWIFFGTNGHKDQPGGSILRDYARRQGALHPFTKYVARSSVFTGEKLMDVKQGHGFWHCPIDKIDQKINVVNVLNENMLHYYDGFPSESAAYVNDAVRKDRILETAVVHHYAFRTEKAFQDRVNRGLGGAFDGQVIWGELASSEKFLDFIAALNEICDESLVNFWSRYLVKARTTNVIFDEDQIVVPESPSDVYAIDHLNKTPISRQKRATQSSISRWSVGTDVDSDAAGAINGLIDGSGKFHTELEDSPWWKVDLGEIVGITKIKIFNNMQQLVIAQRSSKLAIDVGINTNDFVEVYRREADEPFGGIDGNPLIFRPVIPIPGRFVRVRLLSRNYLHLDQVEVYGEPLPNLS